RATVAEPKGQMSPVSPIATEVTWRGETWKVGEKAGVELAGKRFRYGPKKPAHGLFVDKKDQLWAFADDGLWRLKGKGSKESAKFATSDAGFDAQLVKDTGDTDDGVLLVLSTGARFVIQSAD